MSGSRVALAALVGCALFVCLCVLWRRSQARRHDEACAAQVGQLLTGAQEEAELEAELEGAVGQALDDLADHLQQKDTEQWVGEMCEQLRANQLLEPEFRVADRQTVAADDARFREMFQRPRMGDAISQRIETYQQAEHPHDNFDRFHRLRLAIAKDMHHNMGPGLTKAARRGGA